MDFGAVGCSRIYAAIDAMAYATKQTVKQANLCADFLICMGAVKRS